MAHVMKVVITIHEKGGGGGGEEGGMIAQKLCDKLFLR